MTTILVELDFTLGERLAKARKHAGLTQDDMAEKLRVSHSTIAKWELDKSQPRNMLRLIEQWAELTGVSPDWLIGFKKPGNSTSRRRNGDRPASRIHAPHPDYPGFDLQRASRHGSFRNAHVPY